MQSHRSLAWTICIVLAVLLSVATFTPLVIPPGKSAPFLFSFPYTLWTGFLVSVLFVLLTWIGTRVHPGSKQESGDKR